MTPGTLVSGVCLRPISAVPATAAIRLLVVQR